MVISNILRIFVICFFSPVIRIVTIKEGKCKKLSPFFNVWDFYRLFIIGK